MCHEAQKERSARKLDVPFEVAIQYPAWVLRGDDKDDVWGNSKDMAHLVAC